MTDREQELITIRITRKEFLLLPIKTRQRIVKEQVDKLIKNSPDGVSNSCEAMGMD